MKQFDESGAGAQPIYREQDWIQPNRCQLVGHQTACSVLKSGDYVQCVAMHFNVNIIDDLN